MKIGTLALAFSLFLNVAGPVATPRRVPVFGAGVATETDQSSADSEAYSYAQTNVNGSCPGVIENGNYFKTADTCNSITNGDTTMWVCNVSLRATCLIGAH
jgi:hypothetical protein